MKRYHYAIQTGATKMKSKLVTAIAVVGLLMGGASGLSLTVLRSVHAATPTVIYNAIPDPQPGNVPSQAFEATATSEYGGQVQFASTERSDPKVTVLMSSWACETGHWTTGDCATTPGATFSHPITINVYNVNPDNSVGSVITTKTQTFDIPYRPSAEPTICNDGRWSAENTLATCFNGLATPISFDLANTTLPDKVIIGVAYNTTHYGSAPIGENTLCFPTPEGCGYDSLNVGTSPAATVGAPMPTANDAYLNSSSIESYCVNTVTTTGTFRLDAGCWGGFLPAIKVEASSLAPNKDSCKNNGWKNRTNPGPFKNQGDCVSYFATKAKNQPALEF